jgi:phosphoesterase RecJ-like protein
VNRLRLNGFALCENLVHYPDHRAALITLTRDELNRYHYQKGDTEDLVNRPLTCPDITYSVFLREETDYIKVSTRSKGDFPVNKLCQEYFNGGGHLNAAGGEFYGTLQEAVDQLLEAMPEFDRYLPQPH